MVEGASNYVGKLRQSQLHLLFKGYSDFEKKQADHLKRSSRGGNRVEAGLHDMHKVPGVKMIKGRKR